MGVVDQLVLSTPNPKFKGTIGLSKYAKSVYKTTLRKARTLTLSRSGDMQYNSALLLYSNTPV